MEAEFAVFEDETAVAAVLGDGHGAGVQAADAVHHLVQLHMGVAREERAAVQRGQLVGICVVAVGQVHGDSVALQQGVVGHAGKGQHHLVHLGLAVAPDRQDLVLQRGQHGDHLLGGILPGQIISRTVVQKIAQQDDLIRIFRFDQLTQLAAPICGAVDVGCNDQFHNFLQKRTRHCEPVRTLAWQSRRFSGRSVGSPFYPRDSHVGLRPPRNDVNFLQLLQIAFRVERLQLFVLPQVQRMVGVALFADGTGAEPLGVVLPADGQHIGNTFGQVLALFDDGTPGGPDRRLFADGEQVAEGLHVLLVEPQVALLLHIVGPGGPLGVDVEHQEGVKPVSVGDPLDGFEGVVQGVGLRRGGVDAHADQGILSPGPQDVPVLGVKIGGIEPLFYIIFVAGNGRGQGLLEGQDLDLGGVGRWNVHGSFLHRGEPAALGLVEPRALVAVEHELAHPGVGGTGSSDPVLVLGEYGKITVHCLASDRPEGMSFTIVSDHLDFSDLFKRSRHGIELLPAHRGQFLTMRCTCKQEQRGQ